MKYNTVCWVASMLLLVSCKNTNQPHLVFSPANMGSTFISLQSDSAYTLKTPKGAIIKIAGNSFDVPRHALVKIELKEAYTAKDILLAGLTTTSNGKLLQSGGMIYFNATSDGNAVKIVKPINITVPTKNYNDSMQLFKGEMKADSSINWVDPVPIDNSARLAELARGEDLFKSNCANCHKPGQEYVAPALAGCRARSPSIDWAYKFINNVNALIETDAYAKELVKKYGSKMTQFNLPKEDIKAILDYCDKAAPTEIASSTVPLPGAVSVVPERVSKVDSFDMGNYDAPCGYDTIYYPSTDTISIFSTIEVKDTSITVIDTSVYNYQPDPISIYQFNINASGWYNIDCFIIVNEKGVTNVSLSAIVNNGNEDSLKVYLCVPARTLMTDGFFVTGDYYQFYPGADSIPLILNDKAIVIAVGSMGNQLYYGIAKFTIKKQQVIAIDIKKSSTEQIDKYIHQLHLDEPVKNNDVPAYSPAINTPGAAKDSARNGKAMKIIPKDCDGMLR